MCVRVSVCSAVKCRRQCCTYQSSRSFAKTLFYASNCLNSTQFIQSCSLCSAWSSLVQDRAASSTALRISDMEPSQARGHHTAPWHHFEVTCRQFECLRLFFFPLLPVLKMNDVFVFLFVAVVAGSLCFNHNTRHCKNISSATLRLHRASVCWPKFIMCSPLADSSLVVLCVAMRLLYSYITHISITPHGTHKYLLCFGIVGVECERAVFRLVNDAGHCNCRFMLHSCPVCASMKSFVRGRRALRPRGSIIQRQRQQPKWWPKCSDKFLFYTNNCVWCFFSSSPL